MAVDTTEEASSGDAYKAKPQIGRALQLLWDKRKRTCALQVQMVRNACHSENAQATRAKATNNMEEVH